MRIAESDMNKILGWRKGWGYLAGAGAVGVGMFDWLFYGHTLGWSAAVYLLLVVGLIAGRLGNGRRAFWVMLGLLLGLTVALAEEPTVLGVGLAVVGVGMLAALGVNEWVGSVRSWMVRGIAGIANVVVRPLLDLRVAGQWMGRHINAQPRAARMAVRWIVPMVLGMVFVGLFTLANPVIERWWTWLENQLSGLWEWLPEFLYPGRIAMWGVVGAGLWGLLRPMRTRKGRPASLGNSNDRVKVPPVVRSRGWDEMGMIVRSLVIFNGVFAVQTVLDALYLWGGAQLPAGMTYAAYAHRGAYALVATALLAGVFVLVTFRQGGGGEQSRWARRLVYAWIGQNVVLMISTLWRMQMYVSVYSLTRWRVAAMIWMGLVALGLLWTIWKILSRRDNAWLLRVNVVTAAAVLYGCAFVNFEGMIGWFNVRHCLEVEGTGSKLDVKYLQELGVGALPAVRWVEVKLEKKKSAETHAARVAMETELNQTLEEWRGWTWRRWRVR